MFPLKKKKRPLISSGWDIDTQEELTTIAGKDAISLYLLQKSWCDIFKDGGLLLLMY